MPDVSKIPDLVKIAIARVAGDPAPVPADVNENADMADFGFSFFNFAALTRRLDQIAASFKSTAQVSEGDVENCSKVKDCIALVQTAIK
jgi:hypothetical protein